MHGALPGSFGNDLYRLMQSGARLINGITVHGAVNGLDNILDPGLHHPVTLAAHQTLAMPLESGLMISQLANSLRKIFRIHP